MRPFVTCPPSPSLMNASLSRRSAFPRDLEQMRTSGNPLKAHAPAARDLEALARDELTDDVGDENLAGLRPRTNPKGGMDHGAEEALLGRNRLARVDADAHPHRLARMGLVVPGETPLD